MLNFKLKLKITDSISGDWVLPFILKKKTKDSLNILL